MKGVDESMDNQNSALLNDRYCLDQEIGRGGMGVVFLGWDTLLQRDVAVKILSQESLGSGGAKRLLSEARAVARLDHPNIVTVYDAGQSDGLPFIIMQYVEGKTLEKIRPKKPEDVLPITQQICSALTHAHAKGIIHRDLKPENVFLIQEGESEESIDIQSALVKIVDFGIAHSELASLTIQGEILGTVSYMAPEQALGQKTGPQTDLYALGVILYELTTGQLPFTSDNPLTVISQHINAPVTPPRQLNPEILPKLDDLILQLMNKTPEERPASAQEVEEVVRSLTRPRHDILVLNAPSRTIKAPKHNLPHQLTSFVGRQSEIGEISELIEQDTCRLLTLVGPGGIGKTRLAIEVALQNLSNFPDGTFFVPLAPIASPDFIMSAIADTLGLSHDTIGSGIDPQTLLIDYLEMRYTLLVLDNYEHLIDGTQLLIDILKRAPNVKLLITSRERLNLQGEWLYNVQGLPYPDNGSPDGNGENSALELFFERAKLADAHFAVQEQEREHVVQICQLVEGVPLGIELASVWVSKLSCHEIAGEIEKNLDFLATSMQDVPEKHRSVRAAFNHSWELLGEEQRLIFSKLTVFRGGFLRQAAEVVTGAGLTDLSVLVDKSLLQRDKLGRHDIHQLLRQYAEDKLRAYPEEYDQVRTRHSRFYLGFLRQRKKDIAGDKQLEARNEIRAEIENIHLALQWGIIGGNEQGIRDAQAILHDYYFTQGYYEGVKAFGHIADFTKSEYQCNYDPTKPGGSMYLSALVHQAFFHSMLGATKASEEITEKILPGLHDLDYQYEIAICLLSMGINSAFRAEFKDSERYLIEALILGEQLQENVTVVACQIWLGWIYSEQGDYELARQQWQEGHRISTEINNRLLLAFVQSKLAELAGDTGDHETSIKIQLEARQNFKHFDDKAGIGYSTSRLSYRLIAMGEYSEAKRFGHESLQSFKEINHRWGIPASLCRIGFAEVGLGENQEAWQNFTEALELARKGKILTLVLYSLIGIAAMLGEEDNQEQAVAIFVFVIEHPGTPYSYRVIAQEGLSDIEAELPEDILAAAKEQGKAYEIKELLESIPGTLFNTSID
jgi:serine/threonine protein kinase/tetratricopeptide (TPR) repeat protein